MSGNDGEFVLRMITHKNIKPNNCRDSLVVTHLTTSLPIHGLKMAERTGCLVFRDHGRMCLFDKSILLTYFYETCYIDWFAYVMKALGTETTPMNGCSFIDDVEQEMQKC